MGFVGTRQKHILAPIATATGSFFGAVALASTTTPVDKLSYALFFFVFLLVFLVSVGYLLAGLRWGKASRRGRYRILILSFLIVVALMLRTSGSLQWPEALVLALIGIGLWFYSGRRA